MRSRFGSPITILGLGFVAFVIYGFPGYMSTDSAAQLAQARSDIFTDAHPPIMAVEWAVLDAIVAGPILMLLVQGALFLGGVYGVLVRALTPRTAAIVAVGVLLFPPVLTPMAVIWKDSQMAAFLVAGTALLLDERRRRRMIGFGLIAAGCAFRYNAVAAALPLLVLLFVWKPDIRGWRRYAIAGGATILAAALAQGSVRLLTVERTVMGADVG